MRSKFKFLTAVSAGLLALPSFAVAGDDVDEQLRTMNERMAQMEQQLQATQDELDASKQEVTRQQGVMEKAGLERQGKSGLSGFFSAVEVSGWVAADWFYNFNQPGEPLVGIQNFDDQVISAIGPGFGANTGVNGLFMPNHQDHNSFGLSQLWFEIEKPTTEESRGGFRADLAYGRTASWLNLGVQRTCGSGVGPADDDVSLFDGSGCAGDSASDFTLYQAYVQYLIPGLEANLQAGKFATITGAEVAPTVYNFNITRGVLYTMFQPVTHTGVLVSGEAGPVGYKLGVANSGVAFNAVDPDFNEAKSILGQVSFGGEMFNVATSVVWGPELIGDSGSNTSTGLVDVVATIDPSERFSAWLNFDYLWSDVRSTTLGVHNQSAVGLALAGRVGITEALGFALRAEWAKDNNDWFGIAGGFDPGISEIWTLTGTFDYTLTDNLMLRAEVRWDTVDVDQDGNDGNNVFVKKNFDPDDDDLYTNGDQVVTGLELVYQF
jgi:hypothetical protein